MGAYDCSDRLLKRALVDRVQKEDGRSTMKIVGPIIKLKSEKFKEETMNSDFKVKTDTLLKIMKVLNSKMQDSSLMEVIVEDNKTVIKGLLLKFKLEKKMLGVILNEV